MSVVKSLRLDTWNDEKFQVRRLLVRFKNNYVLCSEITILRADGKFMRFRFVH